MVLKPWIRVLIRLGKYLLLDVQAGYFWSVVGKALQASAELGQTLFSVEVRIMSLVPQTRSAKQLLSNTAD